MSKWFYDKKPRKRECNDARTDSWRHLMRKYFSENKCDETVKTIGEQSSLIIFTQKYLRKCKDTY